MSQFPGKQIYNYFFVVKYLRARSNCLEHRALLITKILIHRRTLRNGHSI